MKLPFKYKNIHSCEAVVLTCIDFRFWRETIEFIEKELGIKYFDFPSLPGAAKAINDCQNNAEISAQCIAVPYSLHHAKTLVIVNHQDCGAYGGSKNFDNDGEEQKFHAQELRKARAKILDKYSNLLKVILVYAKLVDDKENIELLTINGN